MKEFLERARRVGAILKLLWFGTLGRVSYTLIVILSLIGITWVLRYEGDVTLRNNIESISICLLIYFFRLREYAFLGAAQQSMSWLEFRRDLAIAVQLDGLIYSFLFAFPFIAARSDLFYIWGVVFLCNLTVNSLCLLLVKVFERKVDILYLPVVLLYFGIRYSKEISINWDSAMLSLPLSTSIIIIASAVYLLFFQRKTWAVAESQSTLSKGSNFLKKNPPSTNECKTSGECGLEKIVESVFLGLITKSKNLVLKHALGQFYIRCQCFLKDSWWGLGTLLVCIPWLFWVVHRSQGYFLSYDYIKANRNSYMYLMALIFILVPFLTWSLWRHRFPKLLKRSEEAKVLTVNFLLLASVLALYLCICIYIGFQIFAWADPDGSSMLLCISSVLTIFLLTPLILILGLGGALLGAWSFLAAALVLVSLPIINCINLAPLKYVNYLFVWPASLSSSPMLLILQISSYLLIVGVLWSLFCRLVSVGPRTTQLGGSLEKRGFARDPNGKIKEFNASHLGILCFSTALCCMHIATDSSRPTVPAMASAVRIQSVLGARTEKIEELYQIGDRLVAAFDANDLEAIREYSSQIRNASDVECRSYMVKDAHNEWHIDKCTKIEALSSVGLARLALKENNLAEADSELLRLANLNLCLGTEGKLHPIVYSLLLKGRGEAVLNFIEQAKRNGCVSAFNAKYWSVLIRLGFMPYIEVA